MGLRNLLSHLRRMGARHQTPSLIGTRPSIAADVRAAQPHHYANWLEDALRLRPQRRTREIMLASSITTPQAPGKRHAEVAEVIAGPTHSTTKTSETGKAERQTTHVTESLSPETTPTLSRPAPRPATSAPLASIASSADASATPPIDGDGDHLTELEGMDAVQRRLVLIRYLVRQRVYNEGFSAEDTPEQYRWSSPPALPPIDGGNVGNEGNE